MTTLPCRRSLAPSALLLALLVACLPARALAAPASGAGSGAGPDGVIEKIEVEGNEFMSDDAVVALSDIQPGDSFDKATLQKEFMKVWSSEIGRASCRERV